MKRNILIGGILGVLVLASVLLWAVLATPEPPPEPTETSVLFPETGADPNGFGQGSIRYETRSGVVITNDFRTEAVAQNLGSGNYLIHGQASPGEDPSYELVFFETDRSYLISLLRAPLRFAREEAEQDLLRRLGVSADEACGLPIRVTTSFHISETYGGRNLGLSFCPGAVILLE